MKIEYSRKYQILSIRVFTQYAFFYEDRRERALVPFTERMILLRI